MTRARARHLNYEVSSFLGANNLSMQNGMLPNICDLLLLRNNGEDPNHLRPGSQGLRPGLPAIRPDPLALRPIYDQVSKICQLYDQFSVICKLYDQSYDQSHDQSSGLILSQSL